MAVVKDVPVHSGKCASCGKQSPAGRVLKHACIFACVMDATGGCRLEVETGESLLGTSDLEEAALRYQMNVQLSRCPRRPVRTRQRRRERRYSLTGLMKYVFLLFVPLFLFLSLWMLQLYYTARIAGFILLISIFSCFQRKVTRCIRLGSKMCKIRLSVNILNEV